MPARIQKDRFLQSLALPRPFNACAKDVKCVFPPIMAQCMGSKKKCFSNALGYTLVV